MEAGDRTMKDAADGAGEAAAARTGTMTEEPVVLDPTDAAIAEWAERERKRREAWVSGPTAEVRPGQDGILRIPAAPGLGVVLDEAAVRRYVA